MGFIISLLILILGILSHKHNGKWYAPETIFCYQWTLIVGFAACRFFDIYEISNQTWITIFIGVLAFLGGAFLAERIYCIPKLDVKNKMNLVSNGEISFFMLIILIFFIVYTLSGLIYTLRFKNLGYDLAQIREAATGLQIIPGYKMRKGAYYEIVDMIFSVCEIFVVAVSIDAIVNDMRRNWKIFAIVLMLEITRTFTNGGRFNIAYIVIELIVASSMVKRCSLKMYKEQRKVRRIIRFSVILLCMFIIFITFVRGTNANTFLMKCYKYLCGNVKFFDLHLKRLNASREIYIPYAGTYGLWTIIYPIFHLFGVPYSSRYLSVIDNVMIGQEYLQIAPSIQMNAFTTAFYYLYADARIFGVIIGMGIFGVISKCFYFDVIRRGNTVDRVSYMIMCIMIIKSLQCYPLTLMNYVVVLLIILYLKRSWLIKLVPQIRVKI